MTTVVLASKPLRQSSILALKNALGHADHPNVHYDLKIIFDLCQELGMESRLKPNEVAIDSGGGAVLFLQNSESEDDRSIGFKNTSWHTHGDLIFVDGRGYSVEVDYISMVTRLKDGALLICELWQSDQLCDRWLIHRDYNDEFINLDKGQIIKVYRF